MGIKARYTKSEVNKFFEDYYKKTEGKLIELLEFVGGNFVRDARKMDKSVGGFGDITGNLRSSIGYFIVKDGVIIREDVELSEIGTDRHSGMNKVKAFIHQIKESDGLRIYGVAAMNYSVYVEAKGFNVITTQADMLVVDLKDLMSKLK